MKYEERIGAIKLVLQPLLKHSGLIDWREEDSTIADLADKVARAADAACLAAIEEPTPEMIVSGAVARPLDAAMVGMNPAEQANAVMVSEWRAMWSAIPRGDK